MKSENRSIKIPDRDNFRVRSRTSDHSPFSPPKTIVFIPSGAKTQKKEIIHIPDAASERV